MTSTSEGIKSLHPKIIGPLLVFTCMASIVALYALDITFLYEPKHLLGVTNTIFTALIPIIVAFFAARIYLRSGSLNVLLMGCGMLGFGLCAGSAGWLREIQGGANFNVTIYNTGALFGSLCHVTGAVINYSRNPYPLEPGKRGLAITGAYSAIIVFAVLLSFATVEQVIPEFFIQGSGPTALRQVVLGLAIFLYALSSLVFMNNYFRIKSDFLYWYSLCLAMLAVGLFAFYIEKVVGSPIGWVGRTSNYLGTSFALIAILAAVRSGKSRGLPLEEVISSFFVDAEANYKSLVETASDAIISFDQANRVILWNSSAEKIFGYTKGEAIGSPVFGMLIPQEHAMTLKELMEISQVSSQSTIEIVGRHKNGGSFPIEISAFARNLPIGRVSTCILRDITGRKEAEEALSRSREWFRTTLGSIGDAVIATDVSGQVTFLNPIGVELTGWKLEEALGMPIQSVFRIINERTRRPAENIVERVLREGCIVSLANHTALIAPDGREIPIEDSAAPIRDSAGNIIGVVLVFHDVTEKRRTQEVLKQSEEHYRSLFDNMLNGYAYCRMLFEEDEPEDFIYLNVNRAFETLTGLENVSGKKVSEVIPGVRESDPELLEIYGRVATTGVPERFETYVEALGMWFSISVYSPRKEHFVAVFDIITERKKADEALQQKEAALREAQRIAHIGSWYWDAKTDVTAGTEELLRIYGFDPAAQLMPDFREQRGRCYPVEEWERVNAAVQTSLETGIGYELDVQAIRDGETIWVTTRGEAVRDRDGQTVGLRGTVQDITERKHIEEELRESEAKYRTLFENMTEEVHFWQLVRDEDGRIKTWRLVDANPPTIDSWGRTSLDEIKGKTTDEIFGPGAADHYMPIVEKIMTERVPYSFEDYFPNLDKYFRFTSVPLMDYFITTGADITSIKKAEQALRQSRDELELRVHERTAELVSANEDLQKQATLLNLSHDAIFVVDSADVVSFWNSGAEDLYGFTREQAIGNVASEFLQTTSPESLEQVANQVIEKGRWAGELRHTTTWGKELVVESRWALRPGEDGKPAGFLVVNRDITARKLAEEALRSNMARLELVNAELQEFAFIAAHDLQEPLRKIQTFCDIAMKRCAPVLDSSSKGYLDRVVSSAGRMRQLLNDLLEFSRVAARPGPLKKIDLATIVHEAADVFEASVKETGCQIEIENIPAIEADETQMLRLFQNLIGNALKFRAAGTPRIKVYGKLHRQGMCELFVKDNGIGFDPKFAGLIFKPFQRLHGRSEYDGTGMGLAICRKIVERHGGTIRAESEPGKGSAFIIRLPVRQNQLGEYQYAGQQA